MEPSPALAWLLLLSLLADCLKAAQSRDFTVKDIIYLHPSMGSSGTAICESELLPPADALFKCLQLSARPATPYPGGFKCFTCEKAADNYECNRWAPDIYCPRDTRYCYTQHTMEVTGNSISVTKRCVPLEECLSTGCRDSENEGYKICTSCCEGNICNLPLPRNETDATFATTSPINQTNGHPRCVSVIVSCLWVWLGLTL
ncbi:Ly6/PLAUR domain-containing protein 6 [Microtus ochrogaster]|uniref:Ly6/PLAUR domain-containing protein 6 n=1 Tax=Microtus ochrogaster TaxID=79684 RepID=A0A8J6FWB5_MICOH|nr:Ly6/PLAUR domain-containing protein 6 [Microtus ochrogaster]